MFRMISVTGVLPLLMPGVMVYNTGLSRCIFPCQDIYLDHLLQFYCSSHQFQYMLLPLKLATMPRVFTTVVAVIAAYLRKQGCEIYPCLNNWLIITNSKLKFLLDLHFTLQLLQALDLQVCINKFKLVSY